MVSTTAGKVATGIMAAEARSAVPAPGQAGSPVAVTHSPGQHRRSGPTGRDRRAPGPSADPVRGDQVVIDLVTRAGNGDKRAWELLVERYAPLIWSICRRYRLGGADAEDVAQAVWLKLVDQLDRIRDPAALSGWLSTTARRECGRVLRVTGTSCAWDRVSAAENIPDTQTATAEQELLAAERHAALREAFTRLPPGCQQLLALLIEDPRYRMPRSARGWASRPEASGPTAAGAWTGCAATR